jgi:hypothetical protein
MGNTIIKKLYPQDKVDTLPCHPITLSSGPETFTGSPKVPPHNIPPIYNPIPPPPPISYNTFVPTPPPTPPPKKDYEPGNNIKFLKWKILEEFEGKSLASSVASVISSNPNIDRDEYDFTKEQKTNVSIDPSVKSIVMIMKSGRKGAIDQSVYQLGFTLYDNKYDYKTKMFAISWIIFGVKTDNMDSVGKAILDLVTDKKIDSRLRFRYILAFSDTRRWAEVRVKVVEWGEKINIDLHWSYLYYPINYIRYRLISAQWLLTGSWGLGKDRRDDVKNFLLALMNDDSMEYNERADIADVLINHGSGEQKEKAKEKILELGLESGGYTIYENKQNVHVEEINKSVINFIENDLSADPLPKSGSRFQCVKEFVTELVSSMDEDRYEKYGFDFADYEMMTETLDRIGLDLTLFTTRKMRLGEILQRVWNRIKQKEDQETQIELTRRLVQELIESEDTCSSGHMERMVNVLSGYDFDINISWKDQVISNIQGRLNARLHKLDEESQGDILLALTEKEDEKRIPLQNFVGEEKYSLRDELKKEFVDEEYIPYDDFDKHFKEGIALYLHQGLEG